MNSNRISRKSFLKNIMAATAIIGGGTLLFQGFTEAAVQTELNRTNKIPTSYVDITNASSQTVKSSLPEGYKKANYTVEDFKLDYYLSQTPTSKDMTKEDAAEISAQALWETFGQNLESQVIMMGYSSPIEAQPRSTWTAYVKINNNLSYEVIIDSVTGELFSLGRSRVLDEKVSVAFDLALHKNPKEFEQYAWKVAEKYDVVHGPIKSVEYNGQGYGNNDPDISFEVKGENEEIASMTLSRYDKALLGISFNGSYKPHLENFEKEHKEWLKKVEEYEKANPVDENEPPTLKVLELE